MAEGKPIPPFRMRMHQAGDTLVVEVFGELDVSQAEVFKREVREALVGDASAILLDLSEVGFIDSTGLRALILVSEEAGAGTDKLRIRRSLSPAVKRVLDLAGLGDRLPWVLAA